MRETQSHDKYLILGILPQTATIINGFMMLLCFVSVRVCVWEMVCVALSYKSRMLDLVHFTFPVKLCVQSLSESLGGLARPGASPSLLWPTCRVCSGKRVALSEPVGCGWLTLGDSLLQDCVTRGWTLFLFYLCMRWKYDVSVLYYIQFKL